MDWLASELSVLHDPYLAGEDDIEDMLNKILAGEDEEINKKGQITEFPDEFVQWVKDNEDRMNEAKTKGTLPYFVKDNYTDIEEILHPLTPEQNTTKGWLLNMGKKTYKSYMRLSILSKPKSLLVIWSTKSRS